MINLYIFPAPISITYKCLFHLLLAPLSLKDVELIRCFIKVDNALQTKKLVLSRTLVKIWGIEVIHGHPPGLVVSKTPHYKRKNTRFLFWWTKLYWYTNLNCYGLFKWKVFWDMISLKGNGHLKKEVRCYMTR